MELQKQRVEEQIRQVRAVLSGRKATAAPVEAAPVAAPSEKKKKVSAAPSAKKPRKRVLSEEARQRIAAAQKKRWESFRAAQSN
ncbi:MAG: hypothetical protein K7J47_10645 [Acidobacteria bacterium]|nr:hypothetical protein [Bryobacteraceae bacterium CoA2 C42]MCA2962583.1 hypothetical protein [Acidobacteriaceae bacterium]